MLVATAGKRVAARVAAMAYDFLRPRLDSYRLRPAATIDDQRIAGID